MSTPSYNGEISARALVRAALHARTHGLSHSVHFHGIGDHGGGPARHDMETLRRLQQHMLLPTAICSTLERYSTAILDSGVALPVHHGESSMIFEGCYTTHADTKRYNRFGENLLCTANTLAALVQQDHTIELQTAWHKVLFNQFHDILDGSAIHESYEKNATDYAEVAYTAHTVIEDALRTMEQGRAPGSIAVTNSLGWEREDWVCVAGWQGQKPVKLISEQGDWTIGQPTPQGLGFVARVPAFGTVTYQVEQAQEAPMSDLHAEVSFAPTDARQQAEIIDPEVCPYLRIETPHFRIYMRRDSGILVSFFDKRVARELVGFGLRRGSDYQDSARTDLALNVFQVLEEHPHGMTAWHLDEVHAEHSLLRGATSEVKESGPARLVVEVRQQFRASQITQQICFYRDLARVDFHTVLDWQEAGNDQVGIPNLKVAFTVRQPECQAWFESPFAAAERPSDGQEVPALRWADVGGKTYGFAILNDCKYGYDALGNRLRLTLVRSAYDPDAHSDLGLHEFRYSFLPHPGDWRVANVVQTATGFNQPLLAREVNAGLDSSAVPQQRWQLALVPATSSVLLSGLKIAHDQSGVVIRCYESAGQSAQISVHGLPQGGRIWETTIVEDRLELLEIRDGALSLAFKPWQVRTLLLENAEKDHSHV